MEELDYKVTGIHRYLEYINASNFMLFMLYRKAMLD